MLDVELLFDEMFNLYFFRLKYVKTLHAHCMTFSELSTVHELKWIRDLRGGGKRESRTRSSEREGGGGFVIIYPRKISPSYSNTTEKYVGITSV